MGATRYLQRLGQSWYVRVKVPASIQGRVGNTHIRRALGTRDLDEANRLKWAVVERIQAHLDALRRGHANLLAPRTDAPQEGFEAGVTRCLKITLPDRISQYPARNEALEALAEEWLGGADYTEQTKHQHRHALLELHQFAGSEVQPQQVTREFAATFVEKGIKATKHSYATKRRKLNSLISFWNWLAEQRIVSLGQNPWTGYRLGKKMAAKGRGSKKRPYRTEELVTLFSGRPCFPGLAEVMVLGLLTGARMEELCALQQVHLRLGEKDTFFIAITKSKTQAGIRTLAVSHPLAVQVLLRRWNPGVNPGVRLFPELLPGGYDGKLSWGASKAFGRYRDKRGLSRETDFHSLRRSFITLLENEGVDQVRIARYVGHELPTLAFAVYSGGSSEQTMLATSDAVRYPDAVEATVTEFLKAPAATVRRGRKPRP